MAFCAKCGGSLTEGAAYCPSCGTAVEATPATTPPGAQAAPMSSNVVATLCYLGWFVTAIVFLVLEPYRRDPFVRFHAFQSIFVSAAAVILLMAWSVVYRVLLLISLGLLDAIGSLVTTIIYLGLFVLWLFMMYKAYNNERFMLPWVGPLADKQATA